MKRIALMLCTAAALAVIAGTTAKPVFAWHYQISGNARCDTSTGNYNVWWTVDNTSEPQALSVLSSNRSAVKKGDSVPAHSTRTFSDSLPGSTKGNTSLNLTVNWPGDQAPHYQTGTVPTDGNCKKSSGPPTPTPTPAPSGPCSVDVAVTKTADKTQYMVGDSATYTVTVSNIEQDYCTATDVVVQDSLPAQFTPVSVSDSRCVLSGQVITCDLGEMQPTFTGGQPVTFTVSGRMNAASDSVTNQVCAYPSAGSDQPDSNESNNCAPVTVKVSAPQAAAPKPAPKPKVKKPQIHIGTAVHITKHRKVKHHQKPKHKAKKPTGAHYTP